MSYSKHMWVFWILWRAALALADLCKFEASWSYSVRFSQGKGGGGAGYALDLRTQEETRIEALERSTV